MRSARHQPRSIICPGRGCGRGFVSPSALFTHFESGTCPSGMDRKELNRQVVMRDRNNIITNSNRLLTGPDGSRPPAEPQYLATMASWNGSAFECFLCYKECKTLPSLNKHLRSPAHMEEIYKCPGCSKQSTTLSGLCRHVESGSCGLNQSRTVQDAYNSMVGNMRRLAV